MSEQAAKAKANAGEGANGEGQHTDRTGFLQGLGCYLLWGVMPVYWKLLSAVPAFEVLAWRMVWSCAAVVALCVLVQRTRFLYLFRDPRAVRTFLASGLIVSCNWGVYIWAANSGHLLQTSIGYYLCPLFTIVLGMAFFKERLTPMQTVATVLAALGVGYFIVANGGDIWIAFALALTFSVYGAVKKKGGYPALPGMQYHRSAAVFKRLPELEKLVHNLEKQLAELKK